MLPLVKRMLGMGKSRVKAKAKASRAYVQAKHGSVTAFCHAFRPTKVFAGRDASRDGRRWLSVRRSDGRGWPTSTKALKEGALRIEYWRRRGKTRGHQLVQQLHDLAKSHRMLSGKWQIPLPHNKADLAWMQLATAVHDGSLGARYAKLGTFSKGKDFWAAAYVQDFTDKAHVGEVLQNLRALSLVQPGQHIDFKVDLLSSLHVVCAAERSSALHTCRDKAREDFDSLRDCIPLYSSRDFPEAPAAGSRAAPIDLSME